MTSTVISLVGVPTDESWQEWYLYRCSFIPQDVAAIIAYHTDAMTLQRWHVEYGIESETHIDMEAFVKMKSLIKAAYDMEDMEDEEAKDIIRKMCLLAEIATPKLKKALAPVFGGKDDKD